MSPWTKIRRLGAAAANRAPWVVDLYRLALHPRWEIANWKDYLSTAASVKWIRSIPEPPDGAPIVLLVVHREDIFDLKSGLVLSAALKLVGARPVVLARYARVPRVLRFAKLFGVSAVRYRTEFPLDDATLTAVDETVDRLMSSGLEFEAVRCWSHQGNPLGERVLSTLIRETLDGEPDPARPDLRPRVQELAREILLNYHQAERILDSICPALLLVSETGYGTNGPLTDVAISRGLDIIESSPYAREGALLFKRMNSASGRAPCLSVAPETLKLLEQRPWTARHEALLQQALEERYGGTTALQRLYQHETRTMDREEICRRAELDPARPIAVVFSHVLWDATFFFGEDLFESYARWLEETLRVAISNDRVNWLIKTHPSNVFRTAHGDISGVAAEVELVRRHIGQLPDHVALLLPETDVSSLSLYRHAEYGVTVRGTPGLEMACFGKAVLTAGTSHYSHLGFTYDSRDRQEYLRRLARIEELPALDDAQATLAKRYTLALLRLRPWQAKSFGVRLQFAEEGWHPLDRNLVPRARSLQEAEAYGDLHRWARWAVESDTADYLEDVAI